MNSHLSFFIAIFCFVAFINAQTVNSSSNPPTHTAKLATVPGFKVSGHVDTSSAVGKQEIAISKRQTTEIRPLPAPSKRKNVTYGKDIYPIFKQNCFICHGETIQVGGLRLDTLEFTLTGTKSNKVIVPGKSRQSLLVTAVAQLDDDSAMPPPNQKPLTSKQIGLIRAWIIQGAK